MAAQKGVWGNNITKIEIGGEFSCEKVFPFQFFFLFFCFVLFSLFGSRDSELCNRNAKRLTAKTVSFRLFDGDVLWAAQ